MAAAPRILAKNDFSIVDIDWIEDGLYEFNRHVVGRSDGRGLGFELVAEDGARVGAIAGYSWADMVEIKQFWIEETQRGHGFGRAMLEATIAEAKARDCRVIWVVSYTFQAPGLYELCGFERVAELTDFPPGHSLIVLRLRLPAAKI
jgi:N-acetylglutamate synthase-like GNAT family acetyltransferase